MHLSIIVLGALFVYGLWSIMLPGKVLHFWVEWIEKIGDRRLKRLGRQVGRSDKPQFRDVLGVCNVCMSSLWGAVFYNGYALILGIWAPRVLFLTPFYCIAVAGVISIINRLISR